MGKKNIKLIYPHDFFDTFLEISNIKKELIYKVSLIERREDRASTRIYNTLLMKDEYILKVNLYFDNDRLLISPLEEIMYLNQVNIYYSECIKLFKMNEGILKL